LVRLKPQDLVVGGRGMVFGDPSSLRRPKFTRLWRGLRSKAEGETARGVLLLFLLPWLLAQRLSVLASQRLSVSASQRLSVSASQRLSVSASQRLSVLLSDRPVAAAVAVSCCLFLLTCTRPWATPGVPSGSGRSRSRGRVGCRRSRRRGRGLRCVRG